MKRYLVGMALGALAPIGATHAKSTVTLYGLVDLGLAYQTVTAGNSDVVFDNPGRETSQVALASGQQSSSRWGLKGMEDLGNGLTANFVLESGFNAADGSGSGFSRQTTVGLTKTGIGTIELGRQLSPGSYAFKGIDPFDTSFSQASMDSSLGATNVRLSNMVFLSSADLGGLRLMAGWSFETGLKSLNSPNKPGFGTSQKDRALSLAARYANGPVLLAANFDTYYAPSGPGATDVKQWNVGATYDFKVVKLHGAYGQNIDGRVSGTKVLSNVATSGGDADTRGAVFYEPGARTNQWMLGLSAPVAASGQIFASVQQLRPGGDFTLGERGTQTTSSLGYTYSLSKRTNFYAYYSYMTGASMYSGAKSQILGAGIRHIF